MFCILVRGLSRRLHAWPPFAKFIAAAIEQGVYFHDYGGGAVHHGFCHHVIHRRLLIVIDNRVIQHFALNHHVAGNVTFDGFTIEFFSPGTYEPPDPDPPQVLGYTRTNPEIQPGANQTGVDLGIIPPEKKYRLIQSELSLSSNRYGVVL